MNTHNLPMNCARPRSNRFSARTRRKLAVAAYEHHKKEADVTLPSIPWEKNSAEGTDES